MPAQLVAEAEGFRILVDKPILLMGRDNECDVQFESRKISRRHCCIAQVGDQLIVRDLGSTNGIRINGVRVLEGHLKPGDELSIGNHRYHVRWDALLPGQEQMIVRKVRDKTAGSEAPAHQLSSRIPDVGIAADGPKATLPPPQARNPAAPVIERPELEHADDDSPLPSPAEHELFGMLPNDLKLAPATDDLPALSPRQKPSAQH